MMSPEQLEQFRLSLLRYLDEDGSALFGLPTTRLVARAKSEAYAVDAAATERELEYLKEKQLVGDIDKRISPANRAWKITAAGRDFREQNAR